MTLDELVTTLREEHKNLCNYLTDLDEATTALYEPGGSIFAVRTALWNILHSYLEAGIALDRYEEKRKEKTE